MVSGRVMPDSSSWSERRMTTGLSPRWSIAGSKAPSKYVFDGLAVIVEDVLAELSWLDRELKSLLGLEAMVAMRCSSQRQQHYSTRLSDRANSHIY